MREIVLDTETTGFDHAAGHRIVEIACIELMNHLPTGRAFHRYVNPERGVDAEALLVHGLDDVFLAQHPPFAALVDELAAFIADGPLVIHNAEFDLGLHQCRAEAPRPAADRLPLHRYFDFGAAALSRRPGEPRRAVPALRDRSHGARAARRQARLRAFGVGLSRAGGRAAAGTRSRRDRAGPAPRRAGPAGAPAAAARAERGGTRGPCGVSRETHRALVAGRGIAGAGLLRFARNDSFHLGDDRRRSAGERLLLAQQIGEINRPQQQRHEAALARRVGDDRAGEREEEPRRLDQQDPRHVRLGHVLHRRHRAIDELDEKHAVRAALGVGMDREQHLEQARARGSAP